MPDVVMPRLSDSMEDGTILTWLKATGDTVELGDELLEIETDKATVAYVAEAAGTLEILVAEGESAPVGGPIARIGSAVSEPEAAPAPGPASPPSPPVIGESETPLGSAGVELTAPSGAPVSAGANGNGHRVKATPLARRIAATHGVVLDDISGTGPLGRITRADVLQRAGLSRQDAPSQLPVVRAPAAGPALAGAPGSAPAPTPAGSASAPQEPPRSGVQPISRLQQLIARRMVEAKATVPHFQVQTEVVMDAAIALRAQLAAVAGEGDAVPSLNVIIIKAAAMALVEHPLANGSYQDDAFVLHDQINVGMAVAADNALVVPTVFDAAGKSLGQIQRDTRRLAGRVRDGQISPGELDGGTFTVSNLGMFGMTAIYPVINPPQAAILGVGASRPTLARVDGEIVERNIATLTLSCDHRILYGADAARFLSSIRDFIESPLRLAL